jgi:hypothetical protein
VVAPAIVVGAPVSVPVEVSKLIPAGVAEIEKLAISPPVEFVVNAVPDVKYVRVAEDEDRVNAGAETTVVNEIVETKEVLPELSRTTTYAL